MYELILPLRTRLESVRMRNLFILIVAVMIVTSSVGCQTGLIQPPGPIDYQQATAVIHDPFPIEDIGPTDLGSRPPGYQQPLPSPVRHQIAKDTMPWLGIQGP